MAKTKKLAPTLQHAIAACAKGDSTRAELLCRKVLEAQPGHFEAMNLLGFVLAQTNRIAEAAEWLGRAVAENPIDVAAQSNRGLMLQQLGQLEEALACYDQALKIDANHAGTHSNRGHVLRLLGRLDEALESCDRAIALDPKLPDAQLNRGTALQALGRLSEALASYEGVLELDPGSSLAHNNCGAVLQKLGRPHEARTSYQRAVEIDPNLADAHNNLGALLREMMQPDAAIACFDRAIAARPDYAEAYWNKSLALLSLGDFAAGWPLYEWRWKQEKGKRARRGLTQPLWLGDHTIAGKTILLYAEQGLGDTIQFCRYAKQVADLGARVVLEVPESLLSVMATLEGIAQLVRLGDPLPPFDCQCPLMSLPLALRSELATIPAPPAYLAPDAAKTRVWRAKLGEKRKPRVGVVWSGGFRPDQPELWDVNARRNLDASKLAQLRDVRVDFYSLQKGEPAASDLARLEAAHWNGPAIIDFTANLHDFSDTAALVANLDLVISVDTSIAHLVGALGKPIWVLNRFDTCWRWLIGRTDSPWYPTARIYTQARPGDWDAVLAKVRADLEVRFLLNA